MCLVHGTAHPIPNAELNLLVSRTPETAVTTAANDDLPTVNKKDGDDSPAPRPVNGSDIYVRRRPSTSARNSRIVVQHGSHQSMQVALRPGQVARVTSQRRSRVEQSSSPIPISPAAGRTSYILGNDQNQRSALVHSVSPPIALHAPTPPQAVSPRASYTVVTHHIPSPRATQQSFHSQHSYHSHSRHSSLSGHSHSRSGRHSRSGSSGGRHSNADIVEPPVVDRRVARSRSDAGRNGYVPGFSQHPRASMPSITYQRSRSRERSQERTSSGKSFLHPSAHEVEMKKIDQGLRREGRLREADGQVRGLLGNDDVGVEAARFVYGRNPQMSAGRLGASGERNFEYVDGGRRHYGSQ